MYKALGKIAALLLLGWLPLVAAPPANDWKTVSNYNKETAKKQLTQRLTKYVTFDTQAQSAAQRTRPSGQAQFAKELAKELKKNGAIHVKVHANALVTAEVPSNLTKSSPVVALFARLDTAPGMSGRNVKPQVHTNYQGDDIVIQAAKKLVLNPYNTPQLLRAKGHDIVTASGDTLLGADNKAGIAIIMTFVQYLYDHPALPHGTVKIAFVPDQPSPQLPDLKADYAYTLDGSDVGELTTETFFAKSFTVSFEGNRSFHPGQAMHVPFADNVLMASDFHTLLPRYKRPETTNERRGFILVNDISTRGDHTEIKGIVRAFSAQEMQTLLNDVTQAFNTVKTMNPKGKNFSLTFTDQYKNNSDILPEKSIRLAELAMQAEEITPKHHAARGNTTGAYLAQQGIAAPDLFAGQYNPRSELEYADVDVMEAALRTSLQLVSLWALQPPDNSSY